jgi:hypothetical protein
MGETEITDCYLRERALEMALRHPYGLDSAGIVKAAEAFLAFLKGDSKPAA